MHSTGEFRKRSPQTRLPRGLCISLRYAQLVGLQPDYYGSELRAESLSNQQQLGQISGPAANSLQSALVQTACDAGLEASHQYPSQ